MDELCKTYSITAEKKNPAKRWQQYTVFSSASGSGAGHFKVSEPDKKRPDPQHCFPVYEIQKSNS
jgi:hypothetical protein